MKSYCYTSGLASLLLIAGCSQSQPVAASEPPVNSPAPVTVVAAAPTTNFVALPREFEPCVAELKQRSAAAGVSAATIEQGFATIRPLEDVLRLDRAQPEFTAGFAEYYASSVSADRVARAQRLLQQHQAMFTKIEAEYGVPPQYLLAFWGLETNFGGYFGNTHILSALTTLACEGRRGELFSGELINALKIIDAGEMTPERMRGSWAGAMGNVQFMPTTFLKYAVDGDGDGKRDLWGSVPDAMASAANFLRGLGWQRGVRWGREVRLPEQFDYRQSGIKVQKPLTEWAALGVVAIDGTPLTATDVQAMLIVPTGYTGPVFLAYDNFNVTMGWNRAEAYALAVGLLADRIAGGSAPTRAPVKALRLSRQQVIQIQNFLNSGGFNAGEADGLFGAGTRAAISRFQHANGLVADGFPTPAVLHLLGAE